MSDLPLFHSVGPGSQPVESDGAQLDILNLPSGMETFAMPVLPEPEELGDVSAAMALLEALLQILGNSDRQDEILDLSDLDASNRTLVDQVLGEGEVSVVVNGDESLRIQESVLAGVWRIHTLDGDGKLIADAIEVAPIPRRVPQLAFANAQERVVQLSELPEGVINAPPLVAEINDACQNFNPGAPVHVINLTLLPQTEADLTYLQQQLGGGALAILSRGYGNCRITSTGTRNVWWVQYFNSRDNNILNSLEITEVPDVACAAPEDIADSAERLDEILEVYR